MYTVTVLKLIPELSYSSVDDNTRKPCCRKESARCRVLFFYERLSYFVGAYVCLTNTNSG